MVPVTARSPPMAGNRETSRCTAGYWHDGYFAGLNQKFPVVTVEVQLDGFIGRPEKLDRFRFKYSDPVLRRHDLPFPDLYPDGARLCFPGARLDGPSRGCCHPAGDPAQTCSSGLRNSSLKVGHFIV
jgi:hypothetical protein